MSGTSEELGKGDVMSVRTREEGRRKTYLVTPGRLSYVSSQPRLREVMSHDGWNGGVCRALNCPRNLLDMRSKGGQWDRMRWQ